MSKQQRQDLARVEAKNEYLSDELKRIHAEKAEDAKHIDLLEWLLEGARIREVNAEIERQKLRNQLADALKRADNMTAAWQFELRRADAAELDAAKAKADAAAAVLIVAEAQQDADTAVELAQKALAALVAKDTELTEVQRALEAAVGSGVDREFRP